MRTSAPHLRHGSQRQSGQPCTPPLAWLQVPRHRSQQLRPAPATSAALKVRPGTSSGGGAANEAAPPRDTIKLRRAGAQHSGGTVKQAAQQAARQRQQAADESSAGRWYSLLTGFPFPLGPFFTRRTVRTEVSHVACITDRTIFSEAVPAATPVGMSCHCDRRHFECTVSSLQVVKGQMWCFQQPQNLAGSNVHTNVRMTAIKLRSGGLLIYAPIAATRWMTVLRYNCLAI